jgi:hypothetical protein
MADRSDQRLLQSTQLQSTQLPDRTVEIYEARQVTDVAADYFGRTMIGAQVSKIELVRLLEVIEAAGGKPAVEQRELFTRLTVPTPVLIEFCLNVISGVGANLPLIEDSAQNLRKMVIDAIARANALKL